MLSQFKTCLEELKCRIGAERTELDEALGYAFYNSECITVSQGKIIRFDVSLNQKDKQIIKELINGMGSLDVSAELERIAFYGELVEVALKEALCDSKEKAKIFQTAGISIGVTAGIMML